MTKLLSGTVLLLALQFPSCVTIERTVDEVKSFQISGIMHRTNVEGGCWQFIGDDAETYELTGMKVVLLLREGIRADIVVRGPLDLASNCRVGAVVELIEILRTYYE
ncbi:MAG: hypothetical protein EPO24_06945 [Bacteroidetes bacterium]|nr:MAG: hypothetical protein EPO24_06945 [Bacteroidota bacterium]